jgi:hypothetical protein
MPVNADFKLIKEKSLDSDTELTVSQNLMSGRIFVKFVGNNPRMVLEKNFQPNLQGKLESTRFSKSIRSKNDLKKYFGIKEK